MITVASLVETGSRNRPALAARLARAGQICRTQARRKADPPAARLWLVPSQRRPGVSYLVDRADKTCTCPDFRSHRHGIRTGPPAGWCKHRLAVEMICRLQKEPAAA